MALTIYWTAKIFAWSGSIFSLYSLLRPQLLLRFFMVTLRRKMKCFGFKGTLEPTAHAFNIARLWSVVMAAIFFGIHYMFGNVITLSYVLLK